MWNARIRRLTVVAGLLASWLWPMAAQAQEAQPSYEQPQEGQPLYELEAFGYGGYTPDYPGANHSHIHGLVLPWLTYRGDYLRTDEKGNVTGRVFESRRVELDVSASGSFPASSSNNHVRAGMPDLDWMGEIGPRARVNLYYWQNLGNNDLRRVFVDLPVRAVFSSNFQSRFDYRGLTFNPALAYQNNHWFGTGASFKTSIGPMFASQELMDYFYRVAPQYATATRSAYDASAGYMGSRLKMGFAEPVSDRIRLFQSVDVDYLGGSANADSPLLKKKLNVGGTFGVSVSFYQSSEKADKP